jgi:hypothetical protein
MPTGGTVQESFIDSTHSEQILDRGPLLAQAAELRDDFERGAAVAQELHEDVELFDLDGRVASLEHQSTNELLEALSDKGFSWATIGRILGVTPTAIRKWRRDEGVTSANHRRVAHLLGTTELLRQVQPRIHDAAFWLEAPCHEETTLRRLDLYKLARIRELLALAAERRRPTEVLDDVVPEWRRSHARDERFELVWHEDGAPSIVMRGSPE